MGRKAKVPVSGNGGNKIVSVAQVGTGSQTPYSPEDVRWEVLDRLGIGNQLPEFADE